MKNKFAKNQSDPMHPAIPAITLATEEALFDLSAIAVGSAFPTSLFYHLFIVRPSPTKKPSMVISCYSFRGTPSR